MAFLQVKDENNQWLEIPALKGEMGDKPLKGVDYFTEAELREILEAFLKAANAPQLFAPTIELDDFRLIVTPSTENGSFDVSFGLYSNDILISMLDSTTVNLSLIESPFDFSTISVKAHANGFLPSEHSNHLTLHQSLAYELEPNEYGMGMILYRYNTKTTEDGITVTIPENRQ